MPKVNPPHPANLVNIDAKNDLAPSVITNIADWHWQRNLIEGTTDDKQFIKLLEEFIELYLAMKPGRTPLVAVHDVKRFSDRLLEGNRLHTATNRSHDMKDAMGDMTVVMINLMERNGWTYEECITQAYDAIKDRKGRMIDGTYVKEEDLPENQIKEQLCLSKRKS